MLEAYYDAGVPVVAATRLQQVQGRVLWGKGVGFTREGAQFLDGKVGALRVVGKVVGAFGGGVGGDRRMVVGKSRVVALLASSKVVGAQANGRVGQQHGV